MLKGSYALVRFKEDTKLSDTDIFIKFKGGDLASLDSARVAPLLEDDDRVVLDFYRRNGEHLGFIDGGYWEVREQKQPNIFDSFPLTALKRDSGLKNSEIFVQFKGGDFLSLEHPKTIDLLKGSGCTLMDFYRSDRSYLGFVDLNSICQWAINKDALDIRPEAKFTAIDWKTSKSPNSGEHEIGMVKANRFQPSSSIGQRLATIAQNVKKAVFKP